MKPKRLDLNRMTMQKHELKKASLTVRVSPTYPHRPALAYARARMKNACVHDRAPRACVRTRIGIVSHPHDRDPSRWASIRAQMKDVFTEYGVRGTEAVTLLAGATDHLFAMVASELGMHLSLVIPCKNFHQYFGTPDELSEYLYWRTTARSQTKLDHAKFTRAAFEDASRFVIDTCDVLVIVGSEKSTKPNLGTGDIIRYAHERGKVLVWLDPDVPNVALPLPLIR